MVVPSPVSAKLTKQLKKLEIKGKRNIKKISA